VGVMQDPLSGIDRNVKSADEFFDLAKTATSPFMRAYYQRVVVRYLSSEGDSSEGELRAAERQAISTGPTGK
jgi:hypothetical protein